MDLSQPHAFCPLYILRQIVVNRVMFMINSAVCIIAMKIQNIILGFSSFSRIFFIVKFVSLVIRRFDFVCTGSPFCSFPSYHVDLTDK